ncbi:Cys-tRNA(Pro) deacylase [Atopobiaceae bacterium 24-176]
MRELDAAGVAYMVREYDAGEGVPGRHLGDSVAAALGEDPDSCFKTLVCEDQAGGHVVCCVPVSCEVDLKKAAAAAGAKRLELVPVASIERLTGYVRGGCTPVGMKKRFPTIIDEAATLFDAIAVSGGRRGLQLVLDPADLVSFTGAHLADITREGN